MKKQELFQAFGILRSASAFHFHIFQGMTFLAMLWMFMSWDFSIMGYLDFNQIFYDRGFILNYWTGPAFYITSGQFIYKWLPRPSPETLGILQACVASFSAFGLIGILPRLFARAAFVISLHLIGMHLIANSAMGGGTELLCASLLILSISPKKAFYKLGKKADLKEKSIDFHWPIFLVLFVFGAYYTIAGINKLIEADSVFWGHDLRLDLFSAKAIQDSVFLSSSYHNLYVCWLLSSESASQIIGYFTLIIELIAIFWLWMPSLRLLLPPFLSVMHIVIFFHHGYGGYFIYAFLVLSCIDFNLIREYYLRYRDRNTILVEN
jgi:hypothetical protein